MVSGAQLHIITDNITEQKKAATILLIVFIDNLFIISKRLLQIYIKKM